MKKKRMTNSEETGTYFLQIDDTNVNPMVCIPDVLALCESKSDILVEIEGRNFWFPKREIDALSEVSKERDYGLFIVSRRVARQRGIVF